MAWKAALDVMQRPRISASASRGYLEVSPQLSLSTNKRKRTVPSSSQFIGGKCRLHEPTSPDDPQTTRIRRQLSDAHACEDQEGEG
jgi:hypothetical protein